MQLLLATNDPVLLSYVSALLKDAGIEYQIADEFASAIEGRIGAFPRRVLVHEADLGGAQSLLKTAGLEAELPRDR